ncbi:MAG: DUF2892 domain-containing protein [Thermonemataceae bacterium]|nr:DUF2892 domain-containing protein [Thermonemataceae bacterium]
MKKNMGNIDRVIRTVLASVMIALFVAKVVTGTLGIILAVVAGVFLLTSVVGFCPLYAPLGLNTCPKKQN